MEVIGKIINIEDIELETRLIIDVKLGKKLTLGDVKIIQGG